MRAQVESLEGNSVPYEISMDKGTRSVTNIKIQELNLFGWRFYDIFFRTNI
jgi:hypothetical protein